MEDITNYYLVGENIATSGQPTREQFNKIAAADYQVVVNLALPTSDNAISDEGSIVHVIYLYQKYILNLPC